MKPYAVYYNAPKPYREVFWAEDENHAIEQANDESMGWKVG